MSRVWDTKRWQRFALGASAIYLGLLLCVAESALAQEPASLAPVMESGGPTDLEYHYVPVPQSQQAGDHLFLMFQATPDLGLRLQFSHKGNLQGSQPQFDLSQLTFNTFQKPALLVRRGETVGLPVAAFSFGYRWSLNGSIKPLADLEKEGLRFLPDLFKKSDDLTLLAVQPAGGVPRLLLLPSERFVDGKPMESVAVTLPDLDGRKIHGVGFDRALDYDAYAPERGRVPFVTDRVPGGAQAKLDRRFVYLALGKEMLILPFEGSGSTLRQVIADAAKNQNRGTVEAVRRQNFGGFYGIDITASPFGSGIHWLWAGGDDGVVRVYSLYDPQSPVLLAQFNSPLVTYAKGERTIVGLSVIRNETPQTRLMVTAGNGKTYMFDVARQLLRPDQMDSLQNDLAVMLPGYDIQQDRFHTERVMGNLDRLTVNVELGRESLELVQPVDLPLAKNIWLDRGGALVHLMNQQFRIQQQRRMLQQMLEAIYASFKQEVVTTPSDSAQAARSEFTLWLDKKYGRAQWGNLAYVLALTGGPWARRLPEKVKWLYLGGTFTLGAWQSGITMIEMPKEFERVQYRLRKLGEELRSSQDRRQTQNKIIQTLTEFYLRQSLVLMDMENSAANQITASALGDNLVTSYNQLIIAIQGVMALNAQLTTAQTDDKEWMDAWDEFQGILISFGDFRREDPSNYIDDALTKALSGELAERLKALSEKLLRGGQNQASNIASLNASVTEAVARLQRFTEVLQQKQLLLRPLVEKMVGGFDTINSASVDRWLTQNPVADRQALLAQGRAGIASFIMGQLMLLNDREAEIVRAHTQVGQLLETPADSQVMAESLVAFGQLLEGVEQRLGWLNQALAKAEKTAESDQHTYELVLDAHAWAEDGFLVNLLAIFGEVALRSKRLGLLKPLAPVESKVTRYFTPLSGGSGLARVNQLSWDLLKLPGRFVRNSTHRLMNTSLYRARSTRVLGVTWAVDQWLAAWKQNQVVRLQITAEEMGILKTEIALQQQRAQQLIQAISVISLGR